MSRYFASPEDPWFRVGRVDVSTSVLVAAIGLISGVVWVIVPDLIAALAFWPAAVVHGQLWRVVTWPLANTIGVVFSALMLWYFGSDLERGLGRRRMLWLLLGSWASLTVASTLVALIPFMSGGVLAGLSLIQLTILLLWIAEYPTRPFFFGIPAWAFGLAIVAVQTLSLIAYRDFGSLLSLVLSLGFMAYLARRFGLLSAYEWIPGSSRPRPSSGSPRPARTKHSSRGQVRQEMRKLSDAERLDQLLDQINESGIHNLTDAQRRELKRLRDRLRRE